MQARPKNPKALEKAKFSKAIDLKIVEIKRNLKDLHSYDEEMTQLGNDIRRLFGEIRENLDIKAT
jgi:hypothetical protein